jgi:putative ABC transport system ATP-binding protein
MGDFVISGTLNKQAVVVEDIVKDYTIGSETCRVLKGISFSVSHGEFFSLMGPSGSGKSTLLYLIGGLAPVSGGRIWLDGQELTGRSDSGTTRLRHDKIGFVFQRFNLLPTLTALENVAIPLKLTVFGNGQGDCSDPRELLSMVGLGGKMHHRPRELSIGEQQRVAIARSLVRRPAILLADEPTGSLDRENARRVLEIFERLHGEHNQTIIMVTHDPIVAKKGDRILHLVDGCISDREDLT